MNMDDRDYCIKASILECLFAECGKPLTPFVIQKVTSEIHKRIIEITEAPIFKEASNGWPNKRR